jgi:hypothetical protein
MQRSEATLAPHRVGRGLVLACVATVVAMVSMVLIGCGASRTDRGTAHASLKGPGRAVAVHESPSCDRPTHAVCRVLFIGNSYTYVNNLPATFARLANAGHHANNVAELAVPNATLAYHAASQRTATAVRLAHWNVVVLQEQSEIPSSVRLRETEMLPAARKLVSMIRDAGAHPMLYLTMAHRQGWPENGLAGYSRMQSAIDQGYLAIARQLRLAIAPVGVAWSGAVGTGFLNRLWQTDGSHPTATGTYLAACVFYATTFRQSPVGLSYHAALTASDATFLQALAAHVVLGDPAGWGLLGWPRPRHRTVRLRAAVAQVK